ncbi:protein of unknown function DUF3844 [Kalmanozyma brasiliensis GHG001]|uniref:Vacuolar sorting protein Vps3844 C-terminal domain-containing protein n=1 Tax=Kalmanozyma brasiliensis (strain GHG001) TaxID=1365824 RepID=V5EXW0_KALBG|nr:protein of unknown function DUF3844 [Kalmanozyma brasiliensis GHG001]EST08443.1 protein of unknown function DUF3844 [Kalmanozyma brasiliensis GHG001]
MVRFTTSSLAPWALAATAAIAQVSAKTSLYLSPANHLAAAPISINAEEAHRVLSSHINVGDASRSDDSAIWAHVLRDDKVDQRARVERLFDGHQDEPNRLLVLMHGSAHDDVIPNNVHATHNIKNAPHSDSFDALFDSYMESASQALKSSESALSHLTGSFMDGFGASIEWLTSKSDRLTATWSQQAASFKSTAFDKLEVELRSVEALIAKLDAGKAESTHDLTLQPLRFSGLQEVENTYGANSAEYAKAKELVRSAVEQVTSLFQARSEEQGRTASIAFVVTETHAADASHVLAKRQASDLLGPFGGAAGSGAFFPPLSEGLAESIHADVLKSKKPSGPSPLPKNLAGTCFTSAESLEKATNSCSGHGKAGKTSRGGKPCYRCQCKPTEERKGKKVYWAGAACEKKDVSTEFVLLGSSVLLLVLISAGSVYFLYAQGSEDLPGTLASVTINLK